VNDDGANHLIALSYTRVVGPRTLNEARFGFTRSNILLATEPGAEGGDFGFNTGWAANSPLSLGNIPQLAFAGGFVGGSSSITNLGGGIDQPNRTRNQYFPVDRQSFAHHRKTLVQGWWRYSLPTTQPLV